MKHSKLKWSFTVAALAAMLILGGCKKKVAPPPPPPPPPAAAPTATLTANPTTIEQGQSSTLTWQTTDANDVTITSLGTVEASGSRQVSPGQSTSYHLVAKGAGGTQDATARITVNAAAAPPPPPPARNETLEELVAKYVKDAYFDYDKYDIRPDAEQALAGDAAFFKQHPELKMTIEGHCDERGSTEYNLALGDNRARAARDALVQAGVPVSQLNPISFGKEKPFCTESNEQCWQMNRRAHFVMGANAR